MSLFYKLVRKYDFHTLIILLNLKNEKKKISIGPHYFFYKIIEKLIQKICLDIKFPNPKSKI